MSLLVLSPRSRLGLPEGPDATDHATRSRSWNLKVTPLQGICATAKEHRKEGTVCTRRGWLSDGAVSQESGESLGQRVHARAQRHGSSAFLVGVQRAFEAGAGPGPGAQGSSHWASVTPVCICSLGLSYQDVTDWGLPQQKCICSHFWRLVVQDQHSGGFGLS